jgi:hypothetical protein
MTISRNCSVAGPGREDRHETADAKKAGGSVGLSKAHSNILQKTGIADTIDFMTALSDRDFQPDLTYQYGP